MFMFLVVLPHIAIIITYAYLFWRFLFRYKSTITVKTSLVFSACASLLFMIWVGSDIREIGGPLIAVAYLLFPFYTVVIGIGGGGIGWSFCVISQTIHYSLRSDRQQLPKKWTSCVALIIIVVFGLVVFSITSRYWTLRNISSILEETYTNSIGMEMIKLSRGYYVSKYETRQSEFEKIMGYNPCHPKNSNKPIVEITANEAKEFCTRLTELEKQSKCLPKGYAYALPSFDEWLEYVADASLDGSVTPAGYPDKDLQFSLEVGRGEKNRLGIYDLRGNVREYSRDISGSTGTHIKLGASFNEHRKDFLHIRNKAYSMKSNSKSIDTGFRSVLIRDIEETKNASMDTPLHKAAATGNLEFAKHLIHNKADINAVNQWNATALHQAVVYGHLNIVEILVTTEAYLDCQTKSGWAPLHYCAINGHAKIAKILLENRANVNILDAQLKSPLHLAAKFGHPVLAKILIDNEAAINIQDDFKWTPLHYAAFLGNTEVANVLIVTGADVNKSGNEWTPLDCANFKGHKLIAELLHKHGAK